MSEFFGGIFLIVMVVGVFCMCGYMAGSGAVKQQAFERGYMVECIGKSGYYWECE